MKRNHQKVRFGVVFVVVVIAMGALVIYLARLPASLALSVMDAQERGGRTKTTPTPTPKPTTPRQSDANRKPPLTWQVVLQVEARGSEREGVVRQTVAIIKTRLDAFGLSRFEVQAKSDRILIKLADVPDRERLKKIITAAGGLELVAIISPSSPLPVRTYKTKNQAIASLGRKVPANRRVLRYANRDEPAGRGEVAGEKKLPRWVVVESPSIVEGNELRNVSPVQESADADNYQIAFSLKPAGAERLGTWTGANIHKYMGVVLNGEVKSIASIQGQIFDQGQISGRFTQQSALDTAQVLNSGALPAPVKIVGEGANKLKKTGNNRQ
ncbi:MAG: hypothetical protein ABI596_13675 [Pyrinomonadaceae bacterium]